MTPLPALAALSAGVLELYGGIYAADCAQSASPQVIVSTDSIEVRDGKLRMNGSDVRAAHAYFGRTPPKGFVVALLGEHRGLDLTALVYRDHFGQYLNLDGAPKTMAGLRPSVRTARFHRCAR